jgi:hypothetical protein
MLLYVHCANNSAPHKADSATSSQAAGPDIVYILQA